MSQLFATFSPTDKDSFIVLGSGGLNATCVANATWASARATIGVSSGKWYWEVKINSQGASGVFPCAIATSAATLQATYIGTGATGWSYHTTEATGKKYNNNIGAAYGALAVTNDVIGCALDMDAGTITMYINNSSQGTMFSGLSGTIYPAISIIDAAGVSNLTANFGATTMAYAPPTGFNAGVYTNSGQSINLLIVGQGGGGGGANTTRGGGAGGGAGGYYANSTFMVTPQDYVVTVGSAAGGGGAVQSKGSNGSNSSFSIITALGGGGGGGSLDGTTADGAVGGSGGGAGGNNSQGSHTGGSGIQGYAGGAQGTGATGGGGGGGSSSVGNVSVTTTGGVGGSGTSNSISGSAVTYAAGGGGSGNDKAGAAAGDASAGAGNSSAGAAGNNATANRGGGGGGGGQSGGTVQGVGGSGGSGVVIISFPLDGSTGVSQASYGGTITKVGLNQIHTFTSSGVWTMVSGESFNDFKNARVGSGLSVTERTM